MMTTAIRVFVLGMILAALVAVASAGSYTRSVTNRIMALGAADHIGGAAWETNTAYTQGTYVTNSHQTFIVLDAGTSATSGSGPAGADEITNGSACFFQVLPGRRSLFIIKNISGGTLTLQFDGLSTTNNDGYPLDSGATFGVAEPECWQGPVFMKSTGSTVSVWEY